MVDLTGEGVSQRDRMREGNRTSQRQKERLRAEVLKNKTKARWWGKLRGVARG